VTVHRTTWRTLSIVLLAGTGLTASATGASAASSVKKYKGPIETTRWGPVEALVYIQTARKHSKVTHKISKVQIGVGPENARSEFIDQQSVPILVQETLKKQSYKIDIVSGATATSEGYIASLEKLLKKEHFKST
jgi:uncharacterized protein with FMN-binding domain